MALSAMWLVGCDDPVQPQESLRPGRDFFVLRAGEVTRGAIEEAGDTVFYRLDAPKDVPLRLFFEAHADTLVAQVVDDRPGGDVWQAMASTVHDPMLAIRSTAWFRLSATESYHVRVFGFRASHRGDYSLYLYPLQTEPETVPPRFEIGDTVANEAIDVPGDVDVFYFQGAAGQEVIAFLQTLDGPDGHTLWLSIRDSARALEIRGTLGNAGDTILEARSSGRFVLPQTGTYMARVEGPLWPSYWDRTAYRFHIYPVSRRPESVDARVAIGDTVTGEAIDAVGDVDEFTFTGTAGQEVNVLFRRDSGAGEAIELRLIGPGGLIGNPVPVVNRSLSLDEKGTGRVVLPHDGEYTVRIEGPESGSPERATGAYAFEIYPINRAPESVAPRVAIGDTVTGESIDRPGDVDEFTVAATEGQYLNAVVYSLASDPGAAFHLELLLSDHGFIAETRPGTESDALWATGRIRLPVTGDYTIRIRAYGDQGSMGRGAYGFALVPIDPAPESLAATIAVGDTIVGESIDHIGDVDRFTFYGEKGQKIDLVAWEEPGGRGPFHFKILLPSGKLLPNWELRTGEHSTGPLELPTTGHYTIEVAGASEPDTSTGAYGFVVVLVDPASERVASTIARGIASGADRTPSAGPASLLRLP